MSKLTTTTSPDSARAAVAAAQIRAAARAAEYRRLNPDYQYRLSAECAEIQRETLRRHEISAAEAARLLAD